MADADEDLIPRAQPSTSTTSSTDPSADLEDEAQDFRFLAHLTSRATASSATAAATLPRRGEKDFEPNPTQAQSNTLALSRAAMHDALNVERVLAPRNPVVGQYLPEPKDWRWDVPPRKVEESGKGGRCVVVEKFSTTYARSIGVADYRNWTWLLPEEALFLIERGTLDIRWPDDKVRAFMKGGVSPDEVGEGGEEEAADRTVLRANAHSDNEVKLEDVSTYEDEDEDEHENDVSIETDTRCDDSSAQKPKRKKLVPLQLGEMPMSLQGAYASLIGKSGLTLERYYVYVGLRRLGYIVQRAPTWDDGDDRDESDEPEEDQGDEPQHSDGHVAGPGELLLPPSTPSPTSTPSSARSYSAIMLINRLVCFLFPPQARHYQPATGPLIYPGLYKNYPDIFRALSLIPYHSASTVVRPRSPYTISWHVFKPGNPHAQNQKNKKYRKSAPPPPDFQVVVLDARTTTVVPTLTELGPLLDSLSVTEVQQDKRKIETKMKVGVRSVVLAVVDCGLVSYLRLGDVCSGSEGRLFETKTPAAGTKGGRWKGKSGKSRGGKR